MEQLQLREQASKVKVLREKIAELEEAQSAQDELARKMSEEFEAQVSSLQGEREQLEVASLRMQAEIENLTEQLRLVDEDE